VLAEAQCVVRRRPARNTAQRKLLRPLGIIAPRKPGMLSSQIKNSTTCVRSRRMVRLVSFGHGDPRNDGGALTRGDHMHTVNEHIEIA